MKCSEVIEILECTSFIDNNDIKKNEELEIHLKECNICEIKKDKIKEFDLLLKARLRSVKTPSNLKSTIAENLENHSGNTKREGIYVYISSNKIFSIVASFLLFIIIFVGLPSDSIAGFDELVSDAIKSHNKNLTMDITCSENEKIDDLENWIDKNINFNLSLKDFKDYNIIGDRECHLCDETVAYIFLEKDGIKYSMFIFDSSDFKKIAFKSQSSIVDNHNIKFWQNENYGYCIVNNT